MRGLFAGILECAQRLEGNDGSELFGIAPEVKTLNGLGASGRSTLSPMIDETAFAIRSKFVSVLQPSMHESRILHRDERSQGRMREQRQVQRLYQYATSQNARPEPVAFL